MLSILQDLFIYGIMKILVFRMTIGTCILGLTAISMKLMAKLLLVSKKGCLQLQVLTLTENGSLT